MRIVQRIFRSLPDNFACPGLIRQTAFQTRGDVKSLHGKIGPLLAR